MSLLQASFTQEYGSEVSRDSVISALGLDSSGTSNSLLTRAIKQIFPDVTLRRDRKDNLYPFFSYLRLHYTLGISL